MEAATSALHEYLHNWFYAWTKAHQGVGSFWHSLCISSIIHNSLYQCQPLVKFPGKVWYYSPFTITNDLMAWHKAWGKEATVAVFNLVASLMSLMASLVTTSRMQHCFNVLTDIYHEFLLLFHYYTQQSCRGVYWFHSIRPSVRPASRVCSVAPTVLVGSISNLYILSSNFRMCVVCNVSCQILIVEFFANFYNF